MSNEVTVKQNQDVAVNQTQTSGILASDVIIPQLLLMQGLSDFVTERKAQFGDIVRSTTAEKVGDPDKAIDFIPLAAPKSAWVLEQKNSQGKFEYRRTIDRNASNETAPWSYMGDVGGNEVLPGTPGATEWRRVKRLSVYAILPQDIAAEAAELAKIAKGEMPDLSKALCPVMISFRSTSFNAGKDIVTFFTQAASFNMDAWKYMLKLSCYLEKNDQGTFYVYKVDRAHPKPVPADQLATVQKWASIVSNTQVRVHEPVEGASAVVSDAGVC